MMAIETLVLGVDKGFPELRADIVVVHGHAVLAEELANHLAVGTIDLRGLGRVGVLDIAHGGRLTEKPQEVDVDHDEIEQECHDERSDNCTNLDVPATSLIESLIPLPSFLEECANHF